MCVYVIEYAPGYDINVIIARENTKRALNASMMERIVKIIIIIIINSNRHEDTFLSLDKIRIPVLLIYLFIRLLEMHYAIFKNSNIFGLSPTPLLASTTYTDLRSTFE